MRSIERLKSHNNHKTVNQQQQQRKQNRKSYKFNHSLETSVAGVSCSRFVKFKERRDLKKEREEEGTTYIRISKNVYGQIQFKSILIIMEYCCMVMQRVFDVIRGHINTQIIFHGCLAMRSGLYSSSSVHSSLVHSWFHIYSGQLFIRAISFFSRAICIV